MIRHTLFRFLVLGLFVATLSTCATSPIARQYRQKAESEDLSFSMVLQNPDAYQGDIVLWGGSIIETTNLQNGTEIIVLQEPLGGEERPESAEDSLGRFIAMSSKFLDPAIYEKGRKITLAGQVAGKKTLSLGKTSYTYPVITVKQLHLWKRRHYYYHYVYPYDHWYWGWGPYFGWYALYPPYYRDFDEGYRGDEERGKGGEKDRDRD
jgi:outer membrane lipoprotein